MRQDPRIIILIRRNTSVLFPSFSKQFGHKVVKRISYLIETWCQSTTPVNEGIFILGRRFERAKNPGISATD